MKMTVAMRNRNGGSALGFALIVLPAVLCQFGLTFGGFYRFGFSFLPALVIALIAFVLTLRFYRRRYQLYAEGEVLPGQLVGFEFQTRMFLVISGYCGVVATYTFTSPAGNKITGRESARYLPESVFLPEALYVNTQVLYLNDRNYMML